MRLTITFITLLSCITLDNFAADTITSLQDTVQGLVQGAQAGEPIHIDVFHRDSLPGCAQHIDAALLNGGLFNRTIDTIPGLADISVSYGSFTKSSRVNVVVEPMELIVRLDWTGGGIGSQCHIYSDELRAFDLSNNRSQRLKNSAVSESLLYSSAAAGLYPLWVQYETGTGSCTATVSVYLNSHRIQVLTQNFASASQLNPLFGEGSLSNDASVWHVGTFALSSGNTVGAWQVVNDQGQASATGRRVMTPQGSMLINNNINYIFPMTDVTLTALEVANASGDVSLDVGQSTSVRAKGTVSDVRNSSQYLLGYTSLVGDQRIGILDQTGIFTALAPGDITATAHDSHGNNRSLTIHVTGEGDATDTDSDGLPDATEATIGTDPRQADTDHDGMNDAYEVRNQLNPVIKDANDDRDGDKLTNITEYQHHTAADRSDTDGDRISDGQEITQGSDPLVGGDADGDHLSDDAEIYFHTDKQKTDTDSDFVSDGSEVARGSDPTLITLVPEIFDPDHDNLATLRENWINSHLQILGYKGSPINPTTWDSDNDQLSDGYEVNNGLDPTTSNVTAIVNGKFVFADHDGDGLDDYQEQIRGTNPSLADTDGDGFSDKFEIEHGTNPNNESDKNRLIDSDKDGLTDDQERKHGTNPNDPDTDHDGTSDGEEASQGYDPTNASDHPGDADGPGEPIDPPHYTRAKLTLKVGDPSQSSSEKWSLEVGTSGEDAGHAEYTAPTEGEVGSDIYDVFKRGNVFPVKVNWKSSTLSKPELDWMATINGMGSDNTMRSAVGWSEGTTPVCTEDLSQTSATPVGRIVMYDQDPNAVYSLLQKIMYNGDDVNGNKAEGIQAYLCLPYARIHGMDSEDDQFPKYTGCLEKRPGTVYQPVICIDSGGDVSDGAPCSLFGTESPATNHWAVTAKVRKIDPDSKDDDYTLEWVVPKNKNGGSQNKIVHGFNDLHHSFTLPKGRHVIKLKVTFSDSRYETAYTPHRLIGQAEIHHLAVQEKPKELFPASSSGLGEDNAIGAPFNVTHEVPEMIGPKKFKMDLKIGVKHGRGRVSLDGYPQNEYWGGESDIDLPQVASGQNITGYIQGYDVASSAPGDIEVEVSGGWRVANTESGENVAEIWYGFDTGETTSIKASLLPDMNRDGKIDQKDKVCLDNQGPLRWWINDDCDFESSEENRMDKDEPEKTEDYTILEQHNYKDNFVNGFCDLLDFTTCRIKIEDSSMEFLQDSMNWTLSQKDSAVDIVWTDLMYSQVSPHYSIKTYEGYGSSLSLPAHSADVQRITDTETIAPTQFSHNIDYKGVFMLEGRSESIQPIIVKLKDSENHILGKWELPLRISSVKDMYRWINLRGLSGGSGGRVSSPGLVVGEFGTVVPPVNRPDSITNHIMVVHVHGYAVPPNEAEGQAAEVFKRLYQSGSNAGFSAVIYEGDEHTFLGKNPDFWGNVLNSFQAADNFCYFINKLPCRPSEGLVFTAHSQGNQLVSKALTYANLINQQPRDSVLDKLRKYNLINAAVPLEAYDPNKIDPEKMRDRDWKSYESHLWASNWWKLQTPGSPESKVTWSGLYDGRGTYPATGFPLAKTVNYYSSSDPILRMTVDDAPLGLLSMLLHGGEGAMVNQEKQKGVVPFFLEWLIDSSGGWGWGPLSQVTLYNGSTYRISPQYAPNFFDPKLREDNTGISKTFFFPFRYNAHNPDERWRLLATSIPGLSFATGGPAGRHYPGPKKFDLNGFGETPGYTTDNIRGDMTPGNDHARNVWSSLPCNSDTRPTGYEDCWTHSDFVNLAYSINKPFYDHLVEDSGLTEDVPVPSP